jgi:hypothetical protein
MQHPAFVSGRFYTNFVDKHYTPQLLQPAQAGESEIAAALVVQLLMDQKDKGIQQLQTALVRQNTWKKNRL